MSDSQPYEATGRTAQKMRTRAALVDAARALIASGVTPTVEEAASAASIARTTAYRYFPSQRDLLVAAYPEAELRSLLGDDPAEDVEARLEAVVSEYLRLTIDNEAGLRAALRLALDPVGTDREKLLLRQGRVISWLKDALEPLRGRLSDHAIERLVYAIRAAAGIEALVWLCDVAGLSRDEAKDLMLWSARALLRSALAETQAPHASPAP
ncbi:MAG: TetR family transcriptional regulator [Anaerolineae bacterium]|nr:TetR family transcriptional regulator [Anaerolineae bacterium]